MRLSLFFLLYLSVTMLQAQDANEVVFNVKQPKPLAEATYFYRQQSPEGFSKGGAVYTYTCIQKSGDTLHHYSFNYINDTNAIILRGEDIKIGPANKEFTYQFGTIYYNDGDTIWEKQIDKNGFGYTTAFCNNSVLSNERTSDNDDIVLDDPMAIIEIVGERNVRAAYMLDSNVRIRTADTTYTCIKVLISYSTMQSELYKKGRRWENKFEKVYHRTYYYMRKSDYLPIKIETASSVKELEPYADYTPSAPPLVLFKAIE